MDFEPSDKVKRLEAQVREFVEREVYPAEAVFERQLNEAPSRWQIPPVLEELKAKARGAGLWNLFLPESELGAGLTNLEYAPLCEIMGSSPIAPEVFNCSAPDTGNMETLVRYATPQQQERWLRPLCGPRPPLTARSRSSSPVLYRNPQSRHPVAGADRSAVLCRAAARDSARHRLERGGFARSLCRGIALAPARDR
jgi:hypothetical protein